MSSALMKFINSPTGPKTTHFWGPVANWGFVLAGLEQTTKPEHMISGPMTGALTDAGKRESMVGASSKPRGGDLK